jgi:hypothetical protein
MASRLSGFREIVERREAASVVDHLLNPKNDITVSSLQRAAAMVGRSVSIELA